MIGAPLPDGALLRLTVVAHGKWVDTNHVAVLHEDGSLFVAFQGGDGAPDVPTDADLPATPNQVLDAADVEAVRRLLAAEGFEDLDPSQSASVEDGEQVVLRVKGTTGEHEVLYDGTSSPAIDLVRRWASRS